MINFEQAKQCFEKYLDGFDRKNGPINLKIVHTYKVLDSAEYLAKELGLDVINTELAKLIALLHDIGRFEQERMYGSFIDHQTMDHGDYGVKILFDDGMIRNFINDETYDNIIYKSILNHNKYKIEEGLIDAELFHVKLIRDADKLDNFRVKLVETFEDMSGYSERDFNNSLISEDIYNSFMNHELILASNRKTAMDFWVSYIAFIFDFNFIPSFKYIRDNEYVNRVIDRLKYNLPDTKHKMEEIRKCAYSFLNDKVKDIC